MTTRWTIIPFFYHNSCSLFRSKLREQQQQQQQKVDCGGPVSDVPGKCECGFKHKRKVSFIIQSLLEHLIIMHSILHYTNGSLHLTHYHFMLTPIEDGNIHGSYSNMSYTLIWASLFYHSFYHYHFMFFIWLLKVGKLMEQRVFILLHLTHYHTLSLFCTIISLLTWL